MAKNIMLKYSKHRKQKERRLHLSQLSICGSITGFFHTFLITPIERIKIWSQSHKTHSVHSALALYRNMGLCKGLFGGIKYTFCFQMLSYSVYFPVYELSLKVMSKNVYNVGDL